MGKEKLKVTQSSSLLINKLGKFERLNQEEMKLLINHTVPGLTPVNVVDSKWTGMQLQVEVGQLVPLSAYFGEPMTPDTVLAFIWNTVRIANDCERHGLRVDALRWSYDRVYVDPQGNLQMIYWPVTTLEQYPESPMSFYGGLAGALQNSGITPAIAAQYADYFYQRSYFDFHQFYTLVTQIMEQWRFTRKREREKETDISSWKPGPDLKKQLATGYLELSGTETRIPLDKETVCLGRDPAQCDAVIQGFDGVSRRHAVISCKDDQYFVRDLDSRNGTYLQGQRLKPGEQRPLEEGMTLRLGNADYIFRKMDLNQTVSIHNILRR